MEFQLYESRFNIFKHFLIRWFLVPRLWQRIIRYLMFALAPILVVLYFAWPPAYAANSSLNVALIFSLLYLLLPLANGGLYALRTKPESYRLVIGEANFRCETPIRSGTVELDGIKEILVRPGFVRVSLLTNSFDSYFYVFKDEASKENFELICREFQRLNLNLAKHSAKPN